MAFSQPMPYPVFLLSSVAARRRSVPGTRLIFTSSLALTLCKAASRSATATGANGNVYITSWFNATVTFGNYALTRNGFGGEDIFVAKWSSAINTFVWVQRVGNTGNDRPTGIAVSGTNIYVTGFFNSSTIAFGKTVLTNASTNSNYALFLAKLTDAGASASFTWAQRDGGAGKDYGRAVAVNGANVYVTGESSSLGDTFGTTTTLTSLGGWGVFIGKL